MFLIRTIGSGGGGNTLASLMPSTICKVDFSDYEPGIIVVKGIRRAWLTKSPLLDSKDKEGNMNARSKAVGDFLKETTRMDDDEWSAAMVASDRFVRDGDEGDEVRTPWREVVYSNYNHIFVDVWRFLRESTVLEIGAFKPPCEDVFELFHPDSDGGEGGGFVEKTFERNVLMLPAWAEKGVKIRVEMEDPTQQGVFDLAAGPYEVWWVQGGNKVKFFIEGASSETRREDGLAAVMVLGVLLPEDPAMYAREEDSDEEESDGGEEPSSGEE